MFKTIYQRIFVFVFIIVFFMPFGAYGNVNDAAGSGNVVPDRENSLNTAENSLNPAAPADSGEIGTASAPAAADSSETASSAAVQPFKPDVAEITKDITRLLSNNKKIFFLEQMAALKMSNDNTNVESALNSLYNEREALGAKLAGICLRDGSNKAVKIIKGHVLNTKLYELYGLDSFTFYALNRPDLSQAEGETSAAAIAGNFLKDSLLELKSYIKLENSSLENSPGFISDLDKYMAGLDMKNLAGDAGSNAGPNDGGFSKEESKVLFTPDKLSPGANSTDAPIAGPITIKFNAAKINGAAAKIEVDVKSVKINQKYSRSNSRDAGAIKFGWNANDALLTITSGAPLERNALYGVSVSFNHKIISSEKRPVLDSAADKGFYRSRSVNAGLFKTVDIDLSEKMVSYKLDWNFQTLAYESTSSETALSSVEQPATEENKLEDKSTSETELKDKRDTEENKIGDKTGNENQSGTSESSLNKKDSLMGELYEQPKNMPMVADRSPEGVSIRTGSEIYVIFSCDIDPKSITKDTMQLFCETDKSKFEKLDYKLDLEGRKLTLTPKKPLAASKNYKILVTAIRTSKKLDMPINETFFFKTACAVMDAKFACDGKVKKDETFEVTVSEDLADLSVNFFEVEKKKEKNVEFDICGKVYRQPENKRSIDAMALGSGFKADKISLKNKKAQEKIIKPQGPVTILIKPKTPLLKGRDYKIDVFSSSGIIENGIIKFQAK